MINKFKLGFTLTEVLITLVIIAIISLLLIGLAQNILPNENISLAKKSLNITTRTVQILTNDPAIYIDGTFDSFPLVNGSEMTDTQKNNYFCTKFADELNTKGDIDCTDSNVGSNDIEPAEESTVPGGAAIDTPCSDVERDSFAFKTADGIAWYDLRGQFSGDVNYKVICVSVAPNDASIPLYGIAIRADGKVVPGSILSNCLEADPSMQGAGECQL